MGTVRAPGAAGKQGVGFIGEPENEIELAPSRTTELAEQGQAIEQMAGIEYEHRHENLQQSCIYGKQADCQDLAGPGIDQNAHQRRRPPSVIELRCEQHTKRHAQREVAEQDRESESENGLVH